MSSNKSFDIAIVGGGISGVTLAIALTKRGINCTLYEQAHAFGEIGAGVDFSPNAVRAMKICDQSVYDAFAKVATHNKWESKKLTWFDFVDGMTDNNGETLKTLFTLSDEYGQNAVHRAHFLDEMVKNLPGGFAHFKKHLDQVEGNDGAGKLTLKFHDGTTAEADAVIGCDGIKSQTRKIIVGEDHPSARAVYTHKYAYRGMFPMNDAIEAFGEERATNAWLWMGKNAHGMGFPVNHGETYNLFACVTNPKPWPSTTHLTLPAKQEEALEDFKGFGPDIIKQIKMTESNLDRWALFDLGDHPVPTFYKGRIAISGDAAHATTPHHGAGAGMCIEDSAVLASLLADESVKETKDLEAVFAAFDSNRRERGQWLVQSSRRAGDLYEWRTELGNDFEKIDKELNERFGKIWSIDLEKEIDDAKKDLKKRLGVYLNGNGHV